MLWACPKGKALWIVPLSCIYRTLQSSNRGTTGNYRRKEKAARDTLVFSPGQLNELKRAYLGCVLREYAMEGNYLHVMRDRRRHHDRALYCDLIMRTV